MGRRLGTLLAACLHYVLQDEFRLQHYKPEHAEPETHGQWSGSPVQGRITRHYRGRIFNAVSARIEVAPTEITYLLAMNIPRVPLSELGHSREAGPRRSRQRPMTTDLGRLHHPPDRVLLDCVEVLTVPGRESYPAAILAVGADGSYRVIVHNSVFRELYPDGVPDGRIAELSSRERIEHVREFRRVQADLIARHQRTGRNEGAAILQANREMEALGLLPKRPRLVAHTIDEVPSGIRVFDIPSEW